MKPKLEKDSRASKAKKTHSGIAGIDKGAKGGATMSKSAFTLVGPKDHERNDNFRREQAHRAAFTLIELIVVMSIIAILTLLATPKLLGYTKKAKLVQIVNDVGVTENVIDQYLIERDTLPAEWPTLSTAEITEMTEGKTVYSIQGETASISGTDFKVLPEQYVKKNTFTQLKGTFIANNEGKIYYIGDKMAGVKPEAPPEVIPVIWKDETPIRYLNGEKEEFVKLVDIKYPTGYFQKGETITTEVTVQKLKETYNEYYLNYFVYQEDGTYTQIHGAENWDLYDLIWDLEVGASKTIKFDHVLTTDYTGYVGIEVGINMWIDGPVAISSYTKEKTLNIIKGSWIYYHPNDWENVAIANIGLIGSIAAENALHNYSTHTFEPGISSNHGTIKITSPAGSNKTGMVNSKLSASYGTYEARMKVSSSNSMLNGFFLYGPEDLEHEIDIEILEFEGKWQMWTTIHNKLHPNFTELNAPFDKDDNPGAIYQKKIDLTALGINPSTSYNDYRIDFKPDSISFFLNGTEVSKWDGTFVNGHMELLISSFYSSWVSENWDGTIPTSAIIANEDVLDVMFVRRLINTELGYQRVYPYNP